MLPKILRSLSPIVFITAALAFVSPAPLAAQATPSLVTTRITQPIDENSLITLKGTVHPLANRANDRGAAPDSLPLDRLTLFFKRSDAQETALKQLITSLHTPGSSSYHKWLTADQFGKQFGPSDQDLATVQSWLSSHGFAVTKVNAGRQSIEFNGSAAQFSSTFHAQIHKYVVNGETHYANATAPQIPAALAPVVGGFASLNNFRIKSNIRKLGEATYDPKTGKATPQWTIPTATGLNFPLLPADYAVQYDLSPLYSAGVNGTGQTIAIVNDSNINIYLVQQFRTLFNVAPASNVPQVIIDGNDPGVDGINNPDGANGDSGEAYLDVEWSGAVAPNAQIDLVIGADTALEQGLILALEHAIYGNIAPVVSLSFGTCEFSLGSSNAFMNALYEQGAAQGQTIIVSSGDSGSAACDDDNTQFYAVGGQAVSGFASTPFNVAVGGTDFFYSDYASGGASTANYWNTTPSPSTPMASINVNKAPIPEQPWNDSQYGLNILTYYTDIGNSQATTIAGGGGGASNCATGTYDSNGNTVSCTAGYSKPAWQTGTGVPADGVRDVPDLSLYAADGLNLSYYAMCATDGDCQSVSSGSTVQFSGVGGTSASAPAFAGIMALVNQKYGPQGQADFVLYPLAAQFPAAFHDVTNGNNSVPCNINTTSGGSSGSAPPLDCISVASPITVTDPAFGTSAEGQIGTGTTPQYNATAGYDLATGLGSIDANQLVTNWANIKLTSTTTTLTPSSTSFTHGTSITINGSVTGSSGTPTGDVSILTDSTEPTQQSQAFFTLNSSGAYSGSDSLLPGGTYNVWGQYGGDTKNAQSSSTKTQITVSPEASGVLLNVIDTNNSSLIPNNTNNVPYGTPISFSALVAPSADLTALQNCLTGASSSCPTFGVPTGVVTFADSNTNASRTAVVNTEGDAEINTIDQTVVVPFTNVGAHSITAKFAGDSSYNASTSSVSTYTVVQVTPQVFASTPASTVSAGQAFTMTVFVDSGGVGTPPTGTITATGLPSGSPTSEPLSLTGVDPQTGATAAYANFTVPSSAAAGNYNVTFSYGGDTNYTTAAASGTITIGSASGLKASTTTITANQTATSPSTLTAITITVTGQGTVAPTGTIALQISGDVVGSFTLSPVSGSNNTSAVVLSGSSSQLFQGANTIIAAYSGDANYASSNSAPFNVANPLSDFSMVPQTTIVPVSTGSSATTTINISSTNSFAGAVNLACTPTTVTCSFSNSSPSVTAGGTTPVTLTINAGSSVATGNYNVTVTGTDSTGLYIHTLAIEAVVAPPSTTPSFGLSNSGAITVTQGNSGTSTISVTPAGGFTGNVTLACTSSSSSAVTCSLNPATANVTGTGAVTSTLTISAGSNSGALKRPLDKLFAIGGGAALALLVFFGIPARRRSWRTILGVILFGAVIGIGIGCGSSGNGGGGGGGGGSANYTITVTGTSGSLPSQSTTVNVTVNQ